MRDSDHCTASPGKSESGGTLDDRQKDELHQVANIAIDAYLSRNDSFVPVFEDGTQAVMYLAHSEPENGAPYDDDQKRPKLNFWYQASDYTDRSDDGPETETKGDR
jgi:hypothetical protein